MPTNDLQNFVFLGVFFNQYIWLINNLMINMITVLSMNDTQGHNKNMKKSRT